MENMGRFKERVSALLKSCGNLQELYKCKNQFFQGYNFVRNHSEERMATTEIIKYFNEGFNQLQDSLPDDMQLVLLTGSSVKSRTDVCEVRASIVELRALTMSFLGEEGEEKRRGGCYLRRFKFRTLSPAPYMMICRRLPSTLQYIQERIINIAKEYILMPESTINQVAYRLGFRYPQYFTRVFKKETGMTPIEYRKKISNNHYKAK